MFGNLCSGPWGPSLRVGGPPPPPGWGGYLIKKPLVVIVRLLMYGARSHSAPTATHHGSLPPSIVGAAVFPAVSGVPWHGSLGRAPSPLQYSPPPKLTPRQKIIYSLSLKTISGCASVKQNSDFARTITVQMAPFHALPFPQHPRCGQRAGRRTRGRRSSTSPASGRGPSACPSTTSSAPGMLPPPQVGRSFGISFVSSFVRCLVI